jgi:hypothetical protein
MRKFGTIADRGKDYLEKKPGKDERSTSDGTITTTSVEQKQPEERLAIGAHVVYETIRREGEEELIARRQHWDGPHRRRDSRWNFFITEGFLMAHLPDELSVWRRSARHHGRRAWDGANARDFFRHQRCQAM